MYLRQFLTRKVSNGVAATVILFTALFAPATGAVTSLLGNNIFVGGDLEVTGDAEVGGDVVIDGVIAPQYVEVTFTAPTSAIAVDQSFFIASQQYEVVGIKEMHGVSSASAVHLQVTKESGATAAGDGVLLLANNSSAGFDLQAASNTVRSGTLTSHIGDRQLLAGDRLSVRFSGAVGVNPGLVLTVTLKRFADVSTDVTMPASGVMSVSFNGPAAHVVAADSSDHEIFNFTLNPGADLEVRKTTLTLTADHDLYEASAYLGDIKVIDTTSSVVVAGPFSLDPSTNLTMTKVLTDVYTLISGTPRTFKVTADIAANAPQGMEVTASLGKFTTNSSLYNLDTSAYVTADVSPDAVIVGNAVTVSTPSLSTAIFGAPTSQGYAQGTTSAEMLGFTLSAGSDHDVMVDSVTLTGYVDQNTTGSFVKGSDGTAQVSSLVTTASLFQGASQIGDTEVPAVSVGVGTGGTLAFDGLDLYIPAGQTVTLTLKVDLEASVSSLVASPDRIKWAIANTSDVVATSDGAVSVTNNATNSTTSDAGVRMTITSGVASVAISRSPDDTETEAGNVVGGASNVVLAKYKFDAVDGEITLNKARVHITDGNGVSSVTLYEGATLVGGPVSVDGDGNADFSGMTGFIVSGGSSKTLTVKGNLSSVGASGAASGTNVSVALCDGDNDGLCSGGNGDDSGTFEVRATAVGTTVTHNMTDDIEGRDKLLRKTKPTVSLVALPTTTLVNGDVTALRFSVSADAAGDVAIRGLRAEITPSGDVTISATADSSVRRVGDGSNRPGTATYEGGILYIVFSDEELISAGTTRTFDVRVSTSSVNGGESLSSRLLGDHVLETGTVSDGNSNDFLGLGSSDDEYNFVWSDFSEIPHSGDLGASSSDWTNGTYVKVLPSDSQTMTE